MKNLAISVSSLLAFLLCGFLAASAQPGDYHYDQIIAAKAEADAYPGPDQQIWVLGPQTFEYILPAISIKERKKWTQSHGITTPEGQKAYDEAFNALKASLDKQLPRHIHRDEKFVYKDAAAEKVVIQSLKNAATLQVYKSGLIHSSCKPERDSYGNILDCYRSAFIWARDTSNDYKFCHLYQVTYMQDYMGNGYGPAYGKFVDDNIVACPASK
jgi:hypothetical protein